MFLFGRPEDGPLTYPTWNTPGTNDVPTELLVGGEAVFDLDNDGKLDRVLRSSSETHYMHSAMLLVTKGDSATAPASFNFHKSSFLPCQLDNKNVQIHQCPPFGDGNEEVGLTVQVRPDQAFQFRTRYMSVVPFHYKERTYLGITSQSGERAMWSRSWSRHRQANSNELAFFRKCRRFSEPGARTAARALLIRHPGLENTARSTAPLPRHLGRDTEYGYGLVQAKAAYDRIKSLGCGN